MAEHNLEEKIEAGFRGVNERFGTVNERLDTVTGRFGTVNERLDTVTGRLDTVTERLGTVTGRLDTVTGRLGTLETGVAGVNARLDTLAAGLSGVTETVDTLAGRVDTLDKSVNARIDTLDVGFAGMRADFGELKAHFYEVRDALFADNVKTREAVAITVEAIRTDVRVYADGGIAHGASLENHERRITKLEAR